MANRRFNQFRYGLEKKPVDLYANVTIGATGAATLNAWDGDSSAAAGSDGSRGIKSISRTSAGLYVLTLSDSYVRLLKFDASFGSTTGIPAAPVVGVLTGASDTDVTSATTPKITFQCAFATATADTANVATDPGNGETMYIHVQLENGSGL